MSRKPCESKSHKDISISVEQAYTTKSAAVTQQGSLGNDGPKSHALLEFLFSPGCNWLHFESYLRRQGNSTPGQTKVKACLKAPWGLSPVNSCFSVYVNDLIPHQQLQVIYKKVTDLDTGFLECIFNTLTKLLFLKSKVHLSRLYPAYYRIYCLDWLNFFPYCLLLFAK